MDGATYDFIVIPIIALICLVGWLGTIYWADGHPKTNPRPATMVHPQDAIAGQVNVPRQATAPPKAALSKTVPSQTVPSQTAPSQTVPSQTVPSQTEASKTEAPLGG